MGEQQFHVTLKDAGGQRVQRIVQSAKGTGKLDVRFQLPENFASPAIQVSTFVGAEYSSNLLHRTEGPIPVVR